MMMMSEDTAEDAAAAAAAAEQLLHLVRKLEGGANKVSGELFAFLADAVVEGPGAAIDFFAVFVSALEWAAPEMRVDVLRRLTYSIKNGGGGHRVLSELCAKGALARVLALVQQQSRSVARPVLDEALRLLHVLLSFSVSVHDIKKVLGLLTTDGDARERPAFWNALLGVLRSVQPKDGPNSFFVLSGADSGIELPPCYRFPSNGYTLVMWLRFESFGDEQQQQPVIASLQLEDFTGVQLFVQKQQLVMQSVSGTKGRVETAEFRSVSLVTRRWYFIAVAHEYRLIRKSEVTLFVDGRVAAQSTLVYPRTDANLALGCIATSAADPSFVRQRRQSLCGQLGAFVMLSEAIDPAEVASLFALGPNALSKQGDVGQEAGAMVLPKRSVKIVFAYNARAMRGKSCIETSGTGGAERHATALPGTTVANTMPLHLALHNAGGIRLLLPLFKELSTPIAQGGEDDPADRSGSGIQEMDKDPPTSQALCDLLNFVASLASRDEKYLQEMCSCKFFALLSHVFTECLPPSIWTKNAICALDELVPVCVLEPELLEQLFRQIFFNFGIWSRTSAAVQVQLVSSLMDQAKDQPEYFRKVLGVQGILDILRKYFFFSEEKGVSAATRSGDHDDVVGLRQLLLRLIGIFTKGERSLPTRFVLLSSIFTIAKTTSKETASCSICWRFSRHPDRQLPITLSNWAESLHGSRFCGGRIQTCACGYSRSCASFSARSMPKWTQRHSKDGFPRCETPCSISRCAASRSSL